MLVLVTIVHILVCLFLIIVVLLQSGKSADIAAAFGGMGSQTAFGPRGTATLLSRATTWAAIIFMLTAITLSIMASRRAGTGSVLEGMQTKDSQPRTSAPVKSGVPAGPSTPASPASSPK